MQEEKLINGTTVGFEKGTNLEASYYMAKAAMDRIMFTESKIVGANGGTITFENEALGEENKTVIPQTTVYGVTPTDMTVNGNTATVTFGQWNVPFECRLMIIK